MKKALILISSVFIQMVLGGVYAWSTLGKPLRDLYGLTSLETEMIYGLSIAVFTITMVFSGRLIKKTGPLPLAIVSSLLYFAAFFFASQSGGAFAVLLPCLGIVMGLAIGFGYVTPLTTAVRWFPRHKGLVTGIAVFGFGAGSMITANLANHLLSLHMDILQVFMWMGLVGSMVIMISGLFLSFPKDAESKQSQPKLAFALIVRDPGFWRLFCGMFAGTLGGLVIIGKVSSVTLEFGHPEWALGSVVLIALGNSLGRLFWGAVNDSRPKMTIPSTLTILVLAPLGMILAQTNLPVFLFFVFLTGLGFGGSLVVYASQTSQIYGKNGISDVYPLIFLAYGMAAILGPPLGGWLHDKTDSYLPIFGVASAVALLGLLTLIRPKGKTGS